ncbi:unnamed protein product [Cuscuta europaea]|uniref:Transmembrane protein n=1 Tax=Cuscuta europaea TaxID=41803 RepID=A0A9P1E886_CUSEU|nr:unnamed protein product [Cuscuta europaea]
MMEEESEEIMIRPPLELPPWRNCAARVWKIVLLFLSWDFKSFLCYNFYFIIFMSNNKGGRLMFWFVLSFVFGGNQADSGANSLEALTFSAISLALFGVDYYKEVRGPMDLWLLLVRGRLVSNDFYIDCNSPGCIVSQLNTESLN